MCRIEAKEGFAPLDKNGQVMVTDLDKYIKAQLFLLI